MLETNSNNCPKYSSVNYTEDTVKLIILHVLIIDLSMVQ